MKNKGFTLIELLSVVILLSLTALIATPIFTNTIKTNREHANVTSAGEYIKAIETKLSELELKGEANYESCTAISNESKIQCGEDTIELDYDGKSPISSTLEIDGIGVSSASIKFVPEETIMYDGNSYKTVKAEAETYTVTFDPNGGTVSKTSKKVTVGSTYGNLPVPKRSGYTFKGWRGKNILIENKFDGLPSKWSANQEVDLNFTNSALEIISQQTTSTPGFIYKNIPNIEIGKTYTVSMNIKGIDKTAVGVCLYNQSCSTLSVSTTEFKTISTTFTITENNRNYALIYISSPTIGSGFALRWIQIEEGTTATSYEPYFVTSSTVFNNNKDVTLTAVWEAK